MPSTWPLSNGSFICGNGISVNRTLVQSTPCLSSAATACSQAELLITSTATRLPSRSLIVAILSLRANNAVVVSGGAPRTTAPGARMVASSPCPIACNVDTVLLSATSRRPDCSTGTAVAPLSNLVISTSIPSALKKPCLSAMTAPSASEIGIRPRRIFSCAGAATGVASTASRANTADDARRMTAMTTPVLLYVQCKSLDSVPPPVNADIDANDIARARMLRGVVSSSEIEGSHHEQSRRTHRRRRIRTRAGRRSHPDAVAGIPDTGAAAAVRPVRAVSHRRDFPLRRARRRRVVLEQFQLQRAYRDAFRRPDPLGDRPRPAQQRSRHHRPARLHCRRLRDRLFARGCRRRRFRPHGSAHRSLGTRARTHSTAQLDLVSHRLAEAPPGRWLSQPPPGWGAYSRALARSGEVFAR